MQSRTILGRTAGGAGGSARPVCAPGTGIFLAQTLGRCNGIAPSDACGRNSPGPGCRHVAARPWSFATTLAGVSAWRAVFILSPERSLSHGAPPASASFAFGAAEASAGRRLFSLRYHWHRFSDFNPSIDVFRIVTKSAI